MRLFIRVENGLPVDHPILESNFREVFPEIDPDHLPANFASFVRVPMPETGLWEVHEGTTYEWVDGVLQDVHHVRPMTQAELENKMTEYINSFISFAERELDAAADENKACWQRYIDDLRAVSIPFYSFAVLPSPPQVSATGQCLDIPTLGVSRV